jgi:hypothetical protein
MVVVPLSNATRESSEIPASTADSRRVLRMVAAGTLVASGALLFAGKRRAGLMMALSGTALAMIDQREAVARCWNALPGYLGAIQSVAGRAQAAVEEISGQGERLRRVLSK